MRVLVVDGGGSERRHLVAGLRQASLEVSEASDRFAVKDLLASVTPDMAILCVNPGEMDEYLIADALRNANPEVMIFITSVGGQFSQDYLVNEYAADGWVNRPYVLDDVLESMSQAAGLGAYHSLESGMFSRVTGTSLRVAK